MANDNRKKQERPPVGLDKINFKNSAPEEEEEEDEKEVQQAVSGKVKGVKKGKRGAAKSDSEEGINLIYFFCRGWLVG
jgi:hypothetical protein